jgi:hypothetical protein
MGLFKRTGEAMGHIDKKLLKDGLPARGEVLECAPTTVSLANVRRTGTEQVCDVTVNVTGLAGRPPYQATCKHPIPLIYLPQMQAPGATVAVRVDPDDPQHIALDLANKPPGDPGAGSPDGSESFGANDIVGSAVIHGPDGDATLPTHDVGVRAADILTQGSPCRAVLLLSTPLGVKDANGLDATGLIFNVKVNDGSDFQAQIGMHVKPEWMHLLYPEADLPARAMPDWLAAPSDPAMVTIDFEAALAEQKSQ